MCPSRNETSPGTKASLGSIKNTSPASDSASAKTNQARTAGSPTSRSTTAPIKAAMAAGLQTYSTTARSVATAIQSPTANSAAITTSTAAPVVIGDQVRSDGRRTTTATSSFTGPPVNAVTADSSVSA